MDCCSSNYNADFSKHPHNHHPHNYGGGGGSAASHPYYSQIYNQTSMRYPHTHAAHRDETIATGYGAGNSQQNFYDVGGGGSGGSNSGGSSYERYNNSNNNNNSYLNHQHSSGTYPNTFNNNYGALRDSYGNGNNETNGHYYYHHQNQSTHHQPTTANGFYGSHSYDSYRNVSGNYPYHPHYNNNNTTATTTPPSTGYHHAQQQSLPSHFYPYNNNNSSNSSSEHYNNAATTSSRYYPTPPPSAPPPLPPSQRDPYAMRDPTLHQSNSDDSTYSPSGSDKHNNDNMSLDNFNQNTINSDSATTTPSLVSPTLSATQKSQQLSPNEDTDEITRSKSPLLTKAEHTPKHSSHQQTTCELSKINGDSEGREKSSCNSDCGEEDKQHLHLHQQIPKHEHHNQQQNTLDFDTNHNHHNCNTNNNTNNNNNNTNTTRSPQEIPAIEAAVDAEEQQHSPATAFPFNHHHTTKDFTNSHYRSRKSQRDKDKYFKTISSSRKAFDGQPLSINDPYERCSTPFVSMSPYNQNHMPHNYPPHQRLPPSFPPHGAGHGYWYSQPPHHPHHPWMMNPYARNRRGSFIDAQILPSSVHYGRSPSLHMDKHKIHGIHDETSPPKRTRKRAKPASASKPEVKEDLMKNVTPLPGFLQTFGGTEIGRFSEAFFTTAESPNPYYNNSIESDVESPQPWDYDSLEGPINLQVGAAFQLYGGSENEFDSPINNFSELICNEY